MGGLVAVQALHGLGEAYWMDGRPDLAIDLYNRSLALAREIGDRGYESENLQMICVASCGPDGIADLRHVREMAMESAAIGQAAHLDWHLATVLPIAGLALAEHGQYEEALDYAERGIELCRVLGAPRVQAAGLSEKARIHLCLNQWEMAEKLLAEALTICEEGGHDQFTPRIVAHLALARLRLGNQDMEDRLAEVTVAIRERGQRLHLHPCLVSQAEYHIAAGRYREALEASAELLALAERGSLRAAKVAALRLSGLAKMAKAEEMEAAADLKRSLSLAEDIGGPGLIFEAHRALVKLHRAGGQDSLADKHAGAGREIIAGLAESLSDRTLLQRLTIP